jgi:hypothetical protein
MPNPEPTLLIDGHHGIYIPQIFATRYLTAANCLRCSIPIGYIAILENPDRELYWDAWETVLNNYVTENGETLHQDQDVWLVPPGFKWPED